MSVSLDAPSSPRRRSVGAGAAVRIVLIAVAGVGMLATSIGLFGQVQVEEYSPNTFRSRTSTFFEIPVVRLQVTPAWQAEASSDLRSHLAAKGLLPAKADAAEWEVVRRTRALGGDSPLEPVAIVRDYVEQKDEDGSSVWLQWSKKHPEMAAIFWPEVAAASSQRLYWLLPDLFALAQQAEDLETFREELSRLTAGKYKQANESGKSEGGGRE